MTLCHVSQQLPGVPIRISKLIIYGYAVYSTGVQTMIMRLGTEAHLITRLTAVE